MGPSQEARQNLELVADETLTLFKNVAEKSLIALREESVPSSLIGGNTWNDNRPNQHLQQINQEKLLSYQILAREPAIARVLVAEDGGDQRVYYFCRTTPIHGVDPYFAGYRAPVGRLASLPIGEEFQLPDGTNVEVLQRAILYPSDTEQGWDSQNSIVEGNNFGPFTIESFRALLRKPGPALADQPLNRLLAEENQMANILEGKSRNVITKMGLRDQPILDKYQDYIFRLPLNTRLLLLGPPGTGKTTTLIRRLGQKLDIHFLEQDELDTTESVATSNRSTHTESWLMFTPTELLKQYLKEAFAREGVPAPDQRIKTWEDYRRELGRNTFGVLRTSKSGGTFILKDSINILTTNSLEDPIALFSDFNKWQKSFFVDDLLGAAQKLSENRIVEISAVGQRLSIVIQQASKNSIASMFTSIAAEIPAIQTLLADMKIVTDKIIDGSLNFQLNRDKAFIDELAKLIDGLQLSLDAEVDDQDDQDGDDDEINIPRTGRLAAVSAYKRAVRAQARAFAAKSSIGKTTRNGKIIDWLGGRALSDVECADVGKSLLTQTTARRFVNPVKRFIGDISKRYKVFRRIRTEEKQQWYREDGYKPTDLHNLELDIVLLTILTNANDLLSNPNIYKDEDSPLWSPLMPVRNIYVNQILVDEVTDFSPVQIACMAALSHPRIRSFFACGDFNQRLTIWGSRSEGDMKWVFPDIEIQKVSISYRQSRQLYEFSQSLISITGGTDQDAILPSDVNNEGWDPVLLERALSPNVNLIDWLAQRIREIERFTKQLPSIAIFVPTEKEVYNIADKLSEALANENAKVIACPNGQVIGQDNDVRVFHIEHIKGLEFEAVFFIGVDRLAKQHPDLFNKYLYVGSTRAAAYLGIECDTELPSEISELKSKFKPDWKV